jgi:hypothetical protein
MVCGMSAYTPEEQAEAAVTEAWGKACRRLNDPETPTQDRPRLEAIVDEAQRRYPNLRPMEPECNEAALDAMLLGGHDAIAPRVGERAPSIARMQSQLESKSTPCLATVGSASQRHGESDDPGLFRRERRVFTSPQFYALSSRERDLLLYARMRYMGYNNDSKSNNGRITLTINDLSRLGFDARSLRSAISGLIGAGFLLRTRSPAQGRCAMYALTWRSIGSEPARDTWESIAPRDRSRRKVTSKLTSDAPLAEAA